MTDINYFIKLFTEMLDDPDMGMLPDNLWRRLIELSLMAADYGQDGELPPARQIAWRLRYKPETLQLELDSLVEYGFLSKVDRVYQVIDYDKLVKPIDAKTKAKHYRDRQKRREEAKTGQDKPIITRKLKVTETSPKVTKSATELELDIDIDNTTTTGARLSEFYLAHVNPTGGRSQAAADRLNIILETYQHCDIDYAITEAIDEGANSLKYIETICKRRASGQPDTKKGSSNGQHQQRGNQRATTARARQSRSVTTDADIRAEIERLSNGQGVAPAS